MPGAADKLLIDSLAETAQGDARLICVALNVEETSGQRELAAWALAMLGRNERYCVVLCDHTEICTGPSGFDAALVKAALGDAEYVLLWARDLEDADVLPLLTAVRAAQRALVVVTRPEQYASWRRLIAQYAPRSARLVELRPSPVSAARTLLAEVAAP